jgi:nucleoside-diphosphate-sugar epimerase
MFGLYEYPKRLVPAVATALVRGEEIACTQGSQIRDYSDTRDVAMALAALLPATRVTGAVNIASGEGISVRSLCRLIQEEIGCSSKLLKFGALPDREGDPRSLVADVTRLREQVGFTYSGRLDDRLADTVARYRRALRES